MRDDTSRSLKLAEGVMVVLRLAAEIRSVTFVVNAFFSFLRSQASLERESRSERVFGHSGPRGAPRGAGGAPS